MRPHSSNSESKKIGECPFAFTTTIFNKHRLQSSFCVYSRLTRVWKASWKARRAAQLNFIRDMLYRDD